MFLTRQELQQELQRRGITDLEVDRAAATLAGPDPAGVIPASAVTREEVAHVAAYLHEVRGAFVVPGPVWHPIKDGHPAARAFYWHEYQELQSLDQMGLANPLRVLRRSGLWWGAHARASWQEALYWESLASMEHQHITAAAFLRAHPLRQHDTEELLRRLRASWGVDVRVISRVESGEAEGFYRRYQVSHSGLQRWHTR